MAKYRWNWVELGTNIWETGNLRFQTTSTKRKGCMDNVWGKKANEKLCVGSCRRAANKEQIREALIDRRPDGGTTKKETFYSHTTKRKLLSTKTVFAQKYFIIQCFLTFAKFPHSWQFTMKNYPFEPNYISSELLFPLLLKWYCLLL